MRQKLEALKADMKKVDKWKKDFETKLADTQADVQRERTLREEAETKCAVLEKELETALPGGDGVGKVDADLKQEITR